MPWVIDTCILIDVLDADPEFGQASASTLDSLAEEGLTICPVTYAELAPAFKGNSLLQDEFLIGVGIDFHQEWLWEDTLQSHRIWNDFIQRRKSQSIRKRPIADTMIGAFALRHYGLVTRNTSDFATICPDLRLREPLLESE